MGKKAKEKGVVDVKGKKGKGGFKNTLKAIDEVQKEIRRKIKEKKKSKK